MIQETIRIDFSIYEQKLQQCQICHESAIYFIMIKTPAITHYICSKCAIEIKDCVAELP